MGRGQSPAPAVFPRSSFGPAGGPLVGRRCPPPPVSWLHAPSARGTAAVAGGPLWRALQPRAILLSTRRRLVRQHGSCWLVDVCAPKPKHGGMAAELIHTGGASLTHAHVHARHPGRAERAPCPVAACPPRGPWPLVTVAERGASQAARWSSRARPLSRCPRGHPTGGSVTLLRIAVSPEEAEANSAWPRGPGVLPGRGAPLLCGCR